MTSTSFLPPPVRPGDRVGVAALAGTAAPARVERGLSELRRLGFEPVEATNLRQVDGPFAGTDTQRLEAFHDLAADDDLSAIFFLRGGHGTLRLLDGIDWDLLARRPRAYVGYSDLTPFLLQVVRRLGIVSFHGPMVAAEMARGLESGEGRALLALLEGRGPVVYETAGKRSAEAVSGPLIGGCLSLLVATLGTAHDWEADGRILFWEDIDEPFYRLDRMLTQLRLSGRVSALAGMISGETGLERPELERLARDVPCPLATGLSSGHCRPNLALPLGARADLQPAVGAVRFDLAESSS